MSPRLLLLLLLRLLLTTTYIRSSLSKKRPSSRMPRNKEAKVFSGPDITVIVGESRECFQVNEVLIRQSSPFFDRALAGGWRESQERIVEMPTDDPETFDSYVKWLYESGVPVIDVPSGVFDPATNMKVVKVDPEASCLEYLKLVKAYVLGDKILDHKFQNAVLDALVPKINFSHYFAKGAGTTDLHWEAIPYAYKNTRESDPIRRLFVDMYAKCGNEDWLRDSELNPDNTSLPMAFLLDLSSKLIAKPEPSSGPPSQPDLHTLDRKSYIVPMPTAQKKRKRSPDSDANSPTDERR